MGKQGTRKAGLAQARWDWKRSHPCCGIESRQGFHADEDWVGRSVRGQEKPHPWAGWGWCSQDSPFYSFQAQIQSSSLHNITSPPFQALLPLSLSAPPTRGSSACELPGRTKRNNPSICPGCWGWAGNRLPWGSNRGSSCPQELGDKFWLYQFANGLIFLLMQDLSLPLLTLVSSEAELGEVDPAPKRQSWGPALWAKGEHVPSTIPCWRPGNGNLPGRGFCSFSPQRGTVKLGKAVLPALTAGSSCLK